MRKFKAATSNRDTFPLPAIACSLLAAGILLAGRPVAAIEPAAAGATPMAHRVLQYLYDLPRGDSNRIVSGHLAGGSAGPNVSNQAAGGYKFKMDEIDYLHGVSGQRVGMIGGDYSVGWLFSDKPLDDFMYYHDMNAQMIDYWNQGGLVTITTHQFDPRYLATGGYVNRKDLPPEMPELDITKLTTPGEPVYDNFRVIMDRWSEGLQELADHGVVVLWRPFNEVTNANKWWSRCPADKFKALYQSYFMSWDRVWGPYGRGIPSSLQAMYNDPWMVNLGEISCVPLQGE